MSLTFSAHAQEGCTSWVCMSVCLSVRLSRHTSGMSVHPENTVTYSAGKRGQKLCGVFFEIPPSQRSSTALLKAIRTVGHFSAESTFVHSISCGFQGFAHAWHRGFCTSVHSLLLHAFILCLAAYILHLFL